MHHASVTYFSVADQSLEPTYLFGVVKGILMIE